LSKGRVCGSKPFLRFKAICGKRDVRNWDLGWQAGEKRLRRSHPFSRPAGSELALRAANGAGSGHSEGSRVSPCAAKKIGFSSTARQGRSQTCRKWRVVPRGGSKWQAKKSSRQNKVPATSATGYSLNCGPCDIVAAAEGSGACRGTARRE